jgi:hypothetical protein
MITRARKLIQEILGMTETHLLDEISAIREIRKLIQIDEMMKMVALVIHEEIRKILHEKI